MARKNRQKQTAVSSNGTTAAAGKRPEPMITLQQAQHLGLAVHSIMSQRRDLANRAGYQFGDDRDLYKVLGYKRTLSFDDYQAAYDRQDIAGRIVDAPAEDTWRELPKIVDGDADGGADDTPFVKAWQELASNRRLKLLHFLTRADILSRIGHYAVLLIGVAGEGKLEDEVPAGSVKGIDGILYLQPYDEKTAEVGDLETDPTNERFGLPKFYMIDLGADTAGAEKKGRAKVHWSRVIHIAEDLRRDNINGIPALKRPFNRLFDLEKTVGGAGEAFWRLAYKGMVVSTKEGYSLPSDTDEKAELEDKFDDFVNDTRRILTLDGMEVQELGGESVDPSPTADTALDLIAGTSRIPKRILLGSEVGELASTQDGANYAGYIHTRRTKHAEPIILFELLDRLIFYGVLPPPKSGKYAAVWKPLFELTDLERAEIADKMADAFNKVSGGETITWITPKEFRQTYTTLPAEIDLSDIEAFLEAEDKLNEGNDTAATPPVVPPQQVPGELPTDDNQQTPAV